MKMRLLFSFCLSLLWVGFLPAFDTTSEDISGRWSIETTVQLEGENTPCVYNGTAVVNQSGYQFSGTSSLKLVEGPASCPAEMSAQLTGSVDGSYIGGTLDGGVNFGQASFQGRILTDPAGSVAIKAVVQAGPGISGSTTANEGGPFAGLTATWTSVRTAEASIPMLDPAALVLFSSLLLISGLVVLRRFVL